MIALILLILPFFLLIGLGFSAGRWRRLPEEGLAWMQWFLIYLALPALFFRLMAQAPLHDLANGRFVFGTTLSTYTIFAVAVSFAVLWGRQSLDRAGMMGIAASYSNIGYMGPGLTLAVLGPEAAVPTALIIVCDNALLFALLPLFLAMSQSKQARPWVVVLDVARKILLHPFNLAALLGLMVAAFQLPVPVVVDQVLKNLQAAAAPSALFLLGVTLALRPKPKIHASLGGLLLLKLIVHPALVGVVLLGMGGVSLLWVQTAVLMAALPPALNVFVMARQAGVFDQEASSLILIGTLASVGTLLLWLLLLQATTGLVPL